jgi:carbon storage regulator
MAYCIRDPDIRKNQESMMLILTRRTGEAVVVGKQTKLTVLGVRGDTVRIGFDAPKEIAIHREEIYERINRVVTSMGEPEAPPQCKEE